MIHRRKNIELLKSSRDALRNFTTHPTQSGILQSPVSLSKYGQTFWSRYEQRMSEGRNERAKFMLETADLTPRYMALRLVMGKVACAHWVAELNAMHGAHENLARLEKEIRKNEAGSLLQNFAAAASGTIRRVWNALPECRSLPRQP